MLDGLCGVSMGCSAGLWERCSRQFSQLGRCALISVGPLCPDDVTVGLHVLIAMHPCGDDHVLDSTWPISQRPC